MARTGQRFITLPEKVTVTVSGQTVSVKGPKGELTREFPESVTVSVAGNDVTLDAKNPDDVALWGAYASHLSNMVEGVTTGYTKKLIVEGIGFKAEVKGQELALALGFSHPVAVPIPATLKVTSDKGIITIVGNNKEEVGQFAAEIRALKEPEPYKGKGIRYETEVIRRKEGKKTA